jgi:dTDP-4-amino-4,6-dideoxygalactose transaminase
MSLACPSCNIPAFDYREQLGQLREELLAAISRVLDSGTLILGPEVNAFEQNFADFLGVKGEAVGVGNGTDAIAIALRALGIGSEDEVITVANTAIPTVSAIRMVGARPVFCDVDANTLLMDIEELEQHITPRTRAIVPVHLYGNAVNMICLCELAADRGLAVVEDCAQACGATWQGQLVGTFGDVGCFSFYPTKNLGAYGDAGLCFTGRPDVAQAVRQIRGYGCQERYLAVREGVNSRLDELQAAVLNVKLRYLPKWLAERRAIARRYEAQLDPAVSRPRSGESAGHSYHLFVIESERRGALAEALTKENIGYGLHYPTPIHLMPAYARLGFARGSLPRTERAADRVISLPCYPELTEEAISRVCTVVNDANQKSF